MNFIDVLLPILTQSSFTFHAGERYIFLSLTEF